MILEAIGRSVPQLPKKQRLTLHVRFPLPSADTWTLAVARAARPPACAGLSAVSYTLLRHSACRRAGLLRVARDTLTHARPLRSHSTLSRLLGSPLQGLSNVLSTPAAPPEGHTTSARRFHLSRAFRPRGLSPPRRLAPRPTRSEDRADSAPKSPARRIRRRVSSPASHPPNRSSTAAHQPSTSCRACCIPTSLMGFTAFHSACWPPAARVRVRLQPALGMTSSAISSVVLHASGSLEPHRASDRLAAHPPARQPDGWDRPGSAVLETRAAPCSAHTPRRPSPTARHRVTATAALLALLSPSDRPCRERQDRTVEHSSALPEGSATKCLATP